MHVEMGGEDTLALSIHAVRETDELNKDPMPLNTCEANGISSDSPTDKCLSKSSRFGSGKEEESSVKCVRRSSRSTSNKYKLSTELVLKENGKDGLFAFQDSPSLRRSRRQINGKDGIFALSDSPTLRSSPPQSNGKDGILALSDSLTLSRSPRVQPQSNGKDGSFELCNSPTLRRSPRVQPQINGNVVCLDGGTRKRRRAEVEDEGEGLKKPRLLTWVSGKCNGGNSDSGVPQYGNGDSGELNLGEKSSRSKEIQLNNLKLENGNVDKIADEKQNGGYDEELIDSRKSDLGQLSEVCQFNTEDVMTIDDDLVENNYLDGERITMVNGGSPLVTTKCPGSRGIAVEGVEVEKKCDSELKVSSEKCLRSGKIIYKVVDESENKDGKVLSSKGSRSRNESETPGSKQNIEICFIGEPIPEEEAMERWRWRYDLKENVNREIACQ